MCKVQEWNVLPNTHCFHMHHETSLGVQKLTSKHDIFHTKMCETQTWGLFFTLHWGISLADTCDRNVPDDMSVVFSPPSWGCRSASSLINSPQGATDPIFHWPVNRQLASDWIINRKRYSQNYQWWAQSPRSNVRGSSTFKTKARMSRCGCCRIKAEPQ